MPQIINGVTVAKFDTAKGSFAVAAATDKGRLWTVASVLRSEGYKSEIVEREVGFALYGKKAKR